MSIEVLNVEEVNKMIDQHGWKRSWVIEQIGATRTVGYALLRDGMLPKSSRRKREVLGKLSQLLGVEVPQILLTLEAKRTA